jgi:hypothetical protein
MNRRQRRSDSHAEALFFQFEASRERAALDAMVLADAHGLCIAASGDDDVCEELAAHMPLICDGTPVFDGSVQSVSDRHSVRMKRLEVDGADLFLCALGGNDAMRAFELNRAQAGVQRILRA